MMTMKQIIYISGAALTMFGTTAASSIVVNADTTPTTINGKDNKQNGNKAVSMSRAV
ncbi:hypothetical protein [Lentilactobacillus hilgardii]|uniref:hypothetical protein n=1 Tax=Lentilactobacillus hilgardii TaxID=1588 RepID=UPI0039E9D7A9